MSRRLVFIMMLCFAAVIAASICLRLFAVVTGL